MWSTMDLKMFGSKKHVFRRNQTIYVLKNMLTILDSTMNMMGRGGPGTLI